MSRSQTLPATLIIVVLSALIPSLVSAAETKRLEGVLARAQAIDERPLTPGERLTRTALITEVEGNLIETESDAGTYVKRVQAMGPCLDQHIANLRRGKAFGLVAPRDAVQKTVDRLARILANKDEELTATGLTLLIQLGAP
jgi:hypothetical protein